jgi:hypothetical protein
MPTPTTLKWINATAVKFLFARNFAKNSPFQSREFTV